MKDSRIHVTPTHCNIQGTRVDILSLLSSIINALDKTDGFDRGVLLTAVVVGLLNDEERDTLLKNKSKLKKRLEKLMEEL